MVYFYYTKRNKGGEHERENAKSGALTEVTFYILLALYEPKHGYAIMKFVEEETAGRLVLGAGSLYGALNTLLDKGWIAPYGAEDGRKKAYQITSEGQAAVNKEIKRLGEVLDLAQRITGGKRDD